MTSRAIAFVASEIGLPGGEDAILLAVPAAAVGARSPADVASRAIAGLDQAGQYAAIVDAGGGIVMRLHRFRAARHRQRYARRARRRGSRRPPRQADDRRGNAALACRFRPPHRRPGDASAGGDRRGGAGARLPPREEPANSQEPDDDRGATAALAEISNAASSSEPALAAVDGSADATEVEQSAAVDEGVAVAPGVSSQADSKAG